MNPYVTGAMIRRLRENQKMTQQHLAAKINVSEKAVSKWETGRGYPDISLIEPLSEALGVSVIELFSGSDVVNTNRSANYLRLRFYVCPVCGNVIESTGEAVVSCCGITLPPLELEEADGGGQSGAEEPFEDPHRLTVERSDGEYYVTIPHEMTKTHYISFIAAVKDNGVEITKLYPEGTAEARFPIARTRYFLYYCNRHGLFRAPVR